MNERRKYPIRPEDAREIFLHRSEGMEGVPPYRPLGVAVHLLNSFRNGFYLCTTGRAGSALFKIGPFAQG